MTNRIRVAQLSDFAEENPLAVQIDGVDLVAVNHNDTVMLFQGRCPHQGTMLSEGTIEDGALVCRAHGWRYDPVSGVKIEDATVCLKAFPVEIEDGQVMVDRDQVLSWARRGRQEDASSTDTRPLRSLQQLPGPRGLPLVGNSLQVDLQQLHLVLERWAETYGPIYTFKIGRKPLLVIAEPELANKILRDRPETYRRLGTIEPVLRELGVNGVFSAEGEDWRRQRRLVMQALDTRHQRQIFPTLMKVTQRLKKRWEKAANSKTSVEVQKDLMRYTVDITANLAFGYDMNTLEEEGDVIQQDLEKIFPIINSRIFAAFPYWRYLKLPADRSLDDSLIEIRGTVGEFIANSREQISHNLELNERPTNLLEGLLVARDEGDAGFTDEEVFGNAITMLLAGEDTTANTIAWMMHFTVDYPEVQSNMQEEVDAVIGAKEMLSDYDDARKLVYLEAVANETMRLKPVAPILGLETNVDVEVDGLHIPRETSVMLLTRPGVIRESDFPEAGEFRPERWLSESKTHKIRHPHSFMPFGSGPRLCPGRSLALLEMKTAMAMVCRNFDILEADHVDHVGETFAFTMMPTDLYVRFSARDSH